MYKGKVESKDWKMLCNLLFVTLVARLWKNDERVFVLDGVDLRTTTMLSEWIPGLDKNRHVEVAQCFPASYRAMVKKGKTRNLMYGTVRRWILTKRVKVRAAFLDYCGTLRGREKPYPSDPNESPSPLVDIEHLFRKKKLTQDSALGLTICGRERFGRGRKAEEVAVEHVTRCAAGAGLAVEVTTRLRLRAMVFLLFRLKPQ